MYDLARWSKFATSATTEVIKAGALSAEDRESVTPITVKSACNKKKM